MVNAPEHLYRFRPLDDWLLDREIDALDGAYLWSPHFSEMNDPMEAFYQLGGVGDSAIDQLLSPSGKSVSDMYDMAKEAIDEFCLVSFSSSHMDLPMWAYYASNFAGMCLEFSTNEIFLGDFQNERLLPVTYAESPLPPIAFHELYALQEIERRFSRKRLEWQHEKEWRILTGAGGARHYVDDALTRIFLGPKIIDAHAERICALFRNRPTEILRGKVVGYNLRFDVIKQATMHSECERVGVGRLDLDEILFDRDQITSFLKVPLDRLGGELKRIVTRPNTQAISDCYLSSSHDNTVFVSSEHRLRSGRIAYHKTYYDRYMNRVA